MVLTCKIQNFCINLNRKLDLPSLQWLLFKKWLVRLQSSNCSRNVIKPTMKVLDVSDAVWQGVHLKEGMSRILHKVYSIILKTSLTSLLPTMFHGIDKTINDSDKLWRWVHQKYRMSQIVLKVHSIGKSNCFYLAVTDNVLLNQQHNEWEWCSMKVLASKIWNDSNHTKLHSIQKTALTFLSQMMFNWMEKQWMRVICYECECIKNMEWVILYENCIQSRKYSLTLLLWTIFDLIYKIKETYDLQWTNSNNNNQ